MRERSIAHVKLALGRRIRSLRQRQALTQVALAARAGIHPTYLAGVERGERNPALENLYAIATALDVQLAELFRFESGVGRSQ